MDQGLSSSVDNTKELRDVKVRKRWERKSSKKPSSKTLRRNVRHWSDSNWKGWVSARPAHIYELRRSLRAKSDFTDLVSPHTFLGASAADI